MVEAGRGCVIVTGGSRGIGLSIVEALLRGGDRVIAVARQQGEALAGMAASGQDVHFRACDLGEIETLAPFVRDLRREFGAPFALVNNAGIGTPGVLARMSEADIARLVRLNTLSPIMLTRHVVRAMLASSGGRIVNMSSITASTGYSGLSVYSATKASLLGFTRALAREVGPAGITVNAVAPGFVATEMTGALDDEHRTKLRRRSALRRLPEPQDVAAAVAFLLSEGARNVTGTVMTVDAGSTA